GGMAPGPRMPVADQQPPEVQRWSGAAIVLLEQVAVQQGGHVPIWDTPRMATTWWRRQTASQTSGCLAAVPTSTAMAGDPPVVVLPDNFFSAHLFCTVKPTTTGLVSFGHQGDSGLQPKPMP